MRSSTSPTKRALAFYRGVGGECVVLERYIHRAKIRQDVWGADILCRQGKLLIAIQATDHTSHGKHVTKLCANPAVKNWLLGGVTFNIYSESKRGARGEEKKWVPRITQLVINGMGEIVPL